MDRLTGDSSVRNPEEPDYHKPVLLDQVLGFWMTDPDGIYVDATMGGGGHTGALLGKLGRNGRCIGLDRDPDAIAHTARNLQDYRERTTFFEANFGDLTGILKREGVLKVNGILADLGVSSHQINTASKGFSYRFEGPLDMRMNRMDSVPARDIINTYSAEELAGIFRIYGEERNAGRIARAIDAARRQKEISTTLELAEIVKRCVPGRFAVKSLSRIFQALRIVVNREIESLWMLLACLPGILVPGGRAVIISYHSLEDRAVKQAFRYYCKGGEAPHWAAEMDTTWEKCCTALTKKPVRPTHDEQELNPRARSAKLRAIEKK